VSLCLDDWLQVRFTGVDAQVELSQLKLTNSLVVEQTPVSALEDQVTVLALLRQLTVDIFGFIEVPHLEQAGTCVELSLIIQMSLRPLHFLKQV